ncbi:hypothetical protein BO70DRAFT_393281 [Aspergillus heteromorphus CBS 117.55]|uniref:Uncharacterized protein n=1 Tax=Aspergillus heteromorphus CBS 117.55 TaxID=1448321 RepID=A0A317WUJ1_9EURO|nr:uncharacterized protein BO70DRAFT_393281 [Aspergillus heteromorphus CBS 117.55]PWY90093.1 hypothetical protein BO70DRAFT_393281 [Aspergillus heteromorphus CBS 117.55]
MIRNMKGDDIDGDSTRHLADHHPAGSCEANTDLALGVVEAGVCLRRHRSHPRSHPWHGTEASAVQPACYTEYCPETSNAGFHFKNDVGAVLALDMLIADWKLRHFPSQGRPEEMVNSADDRSSRHHESAPSLDIDNTAGYPSVQEFRHSVTLWLVDRAIGVNGGKEKRPHWPRKVFGFGCR